MSNADPYYTMEEMIVLNDEKIVLMDDYVVFDKLAKKLKEGVCGPLGWVQTFLKTRHGLVFDEGPNLVTAQGREFVAQKIFNSYAYLGGNRTDFTTSILSHFAVGSGGATVSGSTVTLNGPFICDQHLLSAISLGISGYLTEPDGVTTQAVKPITASGGSIYLEPQSYTGGGTSCTYYTKMKCTCIIPSGEPSSLGAGETVKIDEAGLYFVNGATARLFSHICFAPKWKEKESELTIIWYILC